MSNEITGRWPNNEVAEQLQRQLEGICGLEIRPSTVLASALQELKLRSKEKSKGSWNGFSPRRLMYLMKGEEGELQEAILEYEREPTPEHGIAVLLEAADVQNYAMMIQDNVLNGLYGWRGGENHRESNGGRS